ncbi:PP2C family protein-serine/threonine phosphatase [Methanobrevibacter sp.]|uniref:PP2C family protein-serine/threonine phosphatase n=1 Tax=Methanobrevibacter sp. TaxID=66852 RepID=UPI00388F8B6C
MMLKFNELIKSRKFIFLFSAAVNIVFIILFGFIFDLNNYHADLIFVPALGLLFGPYAVLGCCAVQILYLLSTSPMEYIPILLINVIVVFISGTLVWKLWYSVLNKYGYDTPNLSKSYNFLKFFLIFALLFVFLYFLSQFTSNYLKWEVYGSIVWLGLFIALIALYSCNYLKIPLYSPKIQFREILPRKIFDIALILSLIVGALYYLKIITFNPTLLIFICVVMFLLKPYDEDVFNIKNEIGINIAYKLIFSLFLVIVAFIVVISLITFLVSFDDFYFYVYLSFFLIVDYIPDIILLFVVPAYVYMFLMERYITNPINKISSSLSEDIKSYEDYGNLKDTLNSISTTNEIKTLADSLVDMENDLMEYTDEVVKVTAANERYKTELEFAESIQSAMIPGDFDSFCEGKNFKISGLMKPAREICGDFYDYFQIDDDNVVFVIGDVDGKGIPASLIMVKVMTLIQDYAKYVEDLSEVCFEVNNLLCDDDYSKLPVNCWMAKFNIKTNELSFVNAEYNMPLIKSVNGNFEFLDSLSDSALARVKDAKYSLNSIQLNPGDEIFLYADGVSEAKDCNDMYYGEDRLADVLNAYSNDDLDKVINHVKTDLDDFYKDSEQNDDITMFMIKILDG